LKNADSSAVILKIYSTFLSVAASSIKLWTLPPWSVFGNAFFKKG